MVTGGLRGSDSKPARSRLRLRLNLGSWISTAGGRGSFFGRPELNLVHVAAISISYVFTVYRVRLRISRTNVCVFFFFFFFAKQTRVRFSTNFGAAPKHRLVESPSSKFACLLVSAAPLPPLVDALFNIIATIARGRTILPRRKSNLCNSAKRAKPFFLLLLGFRSSRRISAPLTIKYLKTPLTSGRQSYSVYDIGTP